MRTAILISGRGSNLQALLSAAREPGYPADISLVLSNRPEAAGLAHARAAGIATRAIDQKAFAGQDRSAFDTALDAALADAKIELVCLAGFMRVLTGTFVDRWRDRLINIHPSLLPAFPGLDTHARALDAGVKLHGCTVHYVREEIDRGPIIGQAAVAVRAEDSPESLASRVLEAEHRLYPACLRLVAEGRAPVVDGRVALPEAANDTTWLMQPRG